MICEGCSQDRLDVQSQVIPRDDADEPCLCVLCLAFELGRTKGIRTGRETPTDRDFDWFGTYLTDDDPPGSLTDPQVALAFAGGMHKGAYEATEEGDPFPG